MSSLLRISDAAAMGMHAMVLLAAAGDHPSPVAALAGRLQVSPDHLAKVMQRLVKTGLVRSERGRAGGFVLARAGNSVTLLDVFEAIDGPMQPRTCLLPRPVCGGAACVLGRLLGGINEQFARSLGGTTLADVAGAEWLLRVPAAETESDPPRQTKGHEADPR